MDMQLVEVSPSIAEDFLRHNHANRRINRRVVDRYAADMVRGNWRNPTGEALIFDSNGQLQQGQHRLHAILVSGRTIKFWVMTGAEPDDFLFIDQGLKRTTGQVLQMTGQVSAEACGAIARVFLLMQRSPDRVWTGGGTDVTRQDVVDFVLGNPDAITEASRLHQNAKRELSFPASYGAVALAIKSKSESTEQFMEFHKRVISGAMLPADSPIFALRRWALGRTRGSSGSSDQQRSAVVMTKAWNAYVLDKPIRLLAWRREELPMPTPLPSTY